MEWAGIRQCVFPRLAHLRQPFSGIVALRKGKLNQVKLALVRLDGWLGNLVFGSLVLHLVNECANMFAAATYRIT